MKDDYVVAQRSAMIIRLAEPSHFARRMVAERRPLAIRSDAVAAENTIDVRDRLLCMLACVVIAATFGAVVAYSLVAFLSTL